jgi:hypothetical protein
MHDGKKLAIAAPPLYGPHKATPESWSNVEAMAQEGCTLFTIKTTCRPSAVSISWTL